MCALPIRGIGEATWKAVCNVYPTLDELIAADWDKLNTIPNVGIETSTMIINGINSCIRTIYELKKYIKIEPVRQNDGKLKGKSFCFTGKLKHGRKYYEDLVNANGGQIKSVVKTLDYLVVGEDAGSKLDRAKSLGVKTINEDEFLNMVWE
jgi:DNA ligase (NAD+)